MAWTDERVELLKKYWADGLSASQCANRIGGVSRNAVIGKSMRLGLARRGPCGASSLRAMAGKVKVRSPKAQRSVVVSKVKLLDGRLPKLRAEPFKPRVAPVIPEHERKPLERLGDHDCRWPIGEGPFQFCARRKVPGLPYCEGHASIAYQGPAPSQRGRATFVAKDMAPA